MRTGGRNTLKMGGRLPLERIAAKGDAAEKHARCTRIILLSLTGVSVTEMMAATEMTKATVWRWRPWFVNEGVNGLLRDKIRPPGTASAPDERAGAALAMAAKPPAHDASNWTTREPCRAVMLSLGERFWLSALDRAVPGLLFKRKYCAGVKRDCSCHGASILFVASNVVAGTVPGRNMRLPSAALVIRVLNSLERDIPISRVVHLSLNF